MKYYFSDIVDYILGRMDAESRAAFEKELAADGLLRKMSEDTMKKKDAIQRVQQLSVSEERSAKIFRNLQPLIANKAPAAGDVWMVRNFGKVLLLKVTDVFVRYMLLTNNTHYAMPYDYVFRDEETSFRELAAHTHFAATMPVGGLSHYTGTIRGDYFNFLLAVDSKQPVPLPKGMKPGSAEHTDLYDEWSEWMFMKVTELQEGLLGIEEKPVYTNLQLIAGGLLREETGEPTQTARLAAWTSPLLTTPGESTVLKDDENVHIFAKKSRGSLQIVITFAINPGPKLDAIEFLFEDGSKLQRENVLVERDAATVSFSLKEQIRCFEKQLLSISIRQSAKDTLLLELEYE